MKARLSLHRSGKKADWTKTSRERWNIWQRLAGNTGGALTLGNAMTLAGLGLVLAGLAMIVAEMYSLGFACIVIGRLCDLADGWLANQTKTKSPLGEFLDSAADKLGTAITLVVLGITQTIPLSIAVAIFATQFVLALLSFVRWLQHKNLHPSRLGKLSMAAVWVGLGMFMLMQISMDDSLHDIIGIVAYGVTSLSCVLALGALAGYWRSRR